MPSRTDAMVAERPITRVEARWPRGLRREDAARYVGVSPSKFDEWVKDRRMPQPFRADGCVLWDVRDLDDAFEELKAGATAASDWDDYHGAPALR
jgi:predicted DNA-binding transcriptional regulator AlpA